MKSYSNDYPIDASYGSGTIHYFNIIDMGERPIDLSEMESWNRYEAEYEIIDNVVTVDDINKNVKTLYRKYSSLEQLKSDIEVMNKILGYPDDKGTSTYAIEPEPTIIMDENCVETSKFWLLPATYDLQELNPDIPLVSVEVLSDGGIVVMDELVQASTLDNLVDNAKNCTITVPTEALYAAEQETIETLIGDGNIL